MCREALADKDLYAILNLSPTANSQEIRTAYRRAALATHPDKGGSAEVFHAVTLAFEVLSCPTSRDIYNQSHSHCSNKRCHLRVVRPKNATQTHKPTPNETNDKPIGMETNMHKSLKRKQGFDQIDKRSSPNVSNHLECLRSVLQSMDASQRERELLKMPQLVRVALLTFMQKRQNTTKTRMCVGGQVAWKNEGYKELKRHAPYSNLSGVRTMPSKVGTRYRAHIGIKGLRLYTTWVKDIMTAIEHHITLVRIRRALAVESASDPRIWDNPKGMMQICEEVFVESGISEKDIGLKTFVYTRAVPWLNRNTFIISSTMTLMEALVLYSRLLQAQRTSWEAVRAEWVQLLEGKKRPCAGSLSRADAEAIADKARQHTLEQRVMQVVRGLERALKRQKSEQAKVAKMAAREQRKTAIETAKRAHLEQMALRRRRWLWQERRRWLRKKDLTVAEIIRGIPSHL